MTMQQHHRFNKLLNDVGQRGEKVRVTTDPTTGELVKDGVISKQTIADMNVHMPECNLDYRIIIREERLGADIV
ncbi:hypothetical protein BJ742DRAFT_767096 [Cladochytrium replicatum]|nr:hypothetical protein BJ742DRAFT_767096 [Cladochytrium replicatum]